MNPVSRFLSNRKLKKRHKELRSFVRGVLAADDDILPDKKKIQYQDLLTQIESTGKTDKKAISELEQKLDKIADRSSFFFVMRGWMDVLAVALTVAFGIRGLFLQPFKIPTSSMQPTLFGIHYMDAAESRENSGFFTRILLPFGASRARLEAPASGTLLEGSMPVTRSIPSLILSLFDPAEFYLTGSVVSIGGQYQTLPGDNVQDNIYRYLDKPPAGRDYEKGEVVFDGWVSSGDHLFVDRLSIHLVPLKRGEIFIFNTETLETLEYNPKTHQYEKQPLRGYYFIKRVAGIGGDTLKIKDNILYIRPKGESEFRRADEFSDSLRKIYSGKGGYQGHAPLGLLAGGKEFTVPEGTYFALGDNTYNSQDSRYWGAVPHRNVIGRPLNVFWPISRRWGVVDRLPPLDCDTVFPKKSTLPTDETLIKSQAEQEILEKIGTQPSAMRRQ